MVLYKNHFNIKQAIRAYEKFYHKSVIENIKKTAIQKGYKFSQGTSYIFQSLCQKKGCPFYFFQRGDLKLN
jgi:hypothetical protein